MRNRFDRIRHAISFELIALFIATPLSAWMFNTSLGEMGVVTLVASTVATIWNFIYNLLFDHAMLRITGQVHKTIPIRVLHAVLFEGGILIILLPFIAWHLELSLFDAFIVDASFSIFYLFYAFVFNWAYDVVFPIPELERPKPEEG